MNVFVFDPEDGRLVGSLHSRPDSIRIRPFPGESEDDRWMNEENLRAFAEEFTTDHEDGDHFLRELAQKYPRIVKIIPAGGVADPGLDASAGRTRRRLAEQDTLPAEGATPPGE